MGVCTAFLKADKHECVLMADEYLPQQDLRMCGSTLSAYCTSARAPKLNMGTICAATCAVARAVVT